MDPIIQNRLDLKYDREKKLNNLEKELMKLGYDYQDIRGYALSEYLKEERKNRPNLDKYYFTLVSPDTGLIDWMVKARTEKFDYYLPKKISNLNAEISEAKSIKNSCLIWDFLSGFASGYSIYDIINGGLLVVSIFTFLMCTSSFIILSNDIYHIKKKIFELNEDLACYQSELEHITKVKDEALFKEYLMVLTDYFNSLVKNSKIKEEENIYYERAKENDFYMRSEDIPEFVDRKVQEENEKKKVLEAYREAIQELSLLKMFDKEKEIVKPYVLKRKNR